jgi:hypothetical protein
MKNERVVSKAPVKTGKEQGVKVPRMEIVNDRPWLRVMRRLPVRGGEALTGGVQAWLLPESCMKINEKFE